MRRWRRLPPRWRTTDLGANSYLVKPGNPHDLVAMVQTLHLYWIAYNATLPPLLRDGMR
jgi:hypothetical protein